MGGEGQASPRCRRTQHLGPALTRLHAEPILTRVGTVDLFSLTKTGKCKRGHLVLNQVMRWLRPPTQGRIQPPCVTNTMLRAPETGLFDIIMLML